MPMLQVYTPYPVPYQVAKVLDKRRLSQQITNCNKILAAIEGVGSSMVKNHPVTKMYINHKKWLEIYRNTLKFVKDGFEESAKLASDEARGIKPFWMTEKFCFRHKQRLCTLDPKNYSFFGKYGRIADEIYVDGDWVVHYQDDHEVSREPLKNYM